MPRLPAKAANDPVGVPEWDSSIERLLQLVESIRRSRTEFETVLADTSQELVRLSRGAMKAGLDDVSHSLYRVSRDLDPADIRTTALKQEIGQINQHYHRIVDNPFNRTAARMSHDLTAAWGRTLTR